MVKLTFVIHILGLLLLVGCYNGNNLEVIDGGNCIVVSTTTSRTSLGEKNNGAYPVYWSASDKIAVNGAESQSTAINAENPTIAKFSFDATLQYPYNITYPYTSTTTAEAPMVEFLAEQSYVSGSFCEGSAPMCGYVSQKDEKVELKHLAGVLRFAVKGGEENIVLDKVVVTSKTAKLAGEFSVDCTNGTIAPGENAGNSVTYALPSNFKLSTEEHSYFYIAVPAVEVGECTVDFVEPSGEKMRCVWSSSKPVTAGKVREFASVTYKEGVAGILTPLGTEKDEFLIEYTAHGYVKDTAGNPIAGVAVSDGFNVTTTNNEGYYFMNVSEYAWYIYLSLPAEYEVPINHYGQPCFYQKYDRFDDEYNFTLKPLAGGKEEQFALFAFGDPQVSSSAKVGYFKNEAIPSIKRHADEVKAQGLPCYGITLGDIISNGSSNNDEAYRDDMRDGFAVSKCGLPVFQVMGNHDHIHCNESKPLALDARSPSIFLKHQRNHEDMFGPVNYSFNRGDVHIVGMRDMIHTSIVDGSHHYGFTTEQYEWLKQDLALVPKDKMVVLCVHIQLLNRTARYVSEVHQLLNQFNEAHILSGHTHINRNYEHSLEGLSTTKIYEHNAGAVCGRWWSASNMCGDGTPNGYQVLIAGKNSTGGTFTNWYFIGIHDGQNRIDQQMRVYRGNAITGGPIPENEADNPYGVEGYYAFNYPEDYILANVYNADKRWKIEVFEDDVKTGEMTRIESYGGEFSTLIGDNTFANPRRYATGVEASRDMYTIGCNIGVLGSFTADGPGSGAYGKCLHLYKYQLKNKDAKVVVKATDRFGNVYTVTEFTEGTSYPNIRK